jgi:hypothetical protein
MMIVVYVFVSAVVSVALVGLICFIQDSCRFGNHKYYDQDGNSYVYTRGYLTHHGAELRCLSCGRRTTYVSEQFVIERKIRALFDDSAPEKVGGLSPVKKGKRGPLNRLEELR